MQPSERSGALTAYRADIERAFAISKIDESRKELVCRLLTHLLGHEDSEAGKISVMNDIVERMARSHNMEEGLLRILDETGYGANRYRNSVCSPPTQEEMTNILLNVGWGEKLAKWIHAWNAKIMRGWIKRPGTGMAFGKSKE